MSRTNSLSIMPFIYGFIFGNKKSVITYANNHLDADSKLRINPFKVEAKTDQIVIVKYTKSNDDN